MIFMKLFIEWVHYFLKAIVTIKTSNNLVSNEKAPSHIYVGQNVCISHKLKPFSLLQLVFLFAWMAVLQFGDTPRSYNLV